MMASEEQKPVDTAPVPASEVSSEPGKAAGADKEDKQDAFTAEAVNAEELTAEELRLMADTMPGDGPGD
jgi:hypothetical protein